MLSKIREAALRFDLGCTLWRVAFTQDNRDIGDLLPEQLRMLAAKYPEDCDQSRAIAKLLQIKEGGG